MVYCECLKSFLKGLVHQEVTSGCYARKSTDLKQLGVSIENPSTKLLRKVENLSRISSKFTLFHKYNLCSVLDDLIALHMWMMSWSLMTGSTEQWLTKLGLYL